MVFPQIHIPAIIFYLLASSIKSTQSLKVDGSPSSILTTTYFSAFFSFLQDFHLVAVGNPAPPRPYNPERSNYFNASSADIDIALSTAFFRSIGAKNDTLSLFFAGINLI